MNERVIDRTVRNVLDDHLTGIEAFGRGMFGCMRRRFGSLCCLCRVFLHLGE
jgi:hypothetical protein